MRLGLFIGSCAVAACAFAESGFRHGPTLAAEAPAGAGAPALPAVTRIGLPPFPLGVVSFPNGRAVNLGVNIASGAYHPPAAGARLWTVSDRGPFIACSTAKTQIGVSEAEMCGGSPLAEIAILPGFSPTLYGLEIGEDNGARVTETLPIKDRSGRPVSGLSADDPDDSIGAYDLTGRRLSPEQPGINPGGLVRLADGTFWVVEGYGPSLLHIAADGRIMARIVPLGTETDYAKADYDVLPGLPLIFAHTLANAAYACLTLSPDERTLVMALRAPASPEDKSAATSPFLRVLTFDLSTQTSGAEYSYRLDPPEAFAADVARKPRDQGDVRLAEIIALPGNRLIAVERVARTLRILIAELDAATPILPIYDAPQTEPAFEALDSEQFAASGMMPIRKTLLFDSDRFGDGESAKIFDHIEGVAKMSDQALMLITNNAFGLDGERLRMFRLTFPEPVLR
ncbi:MAG: esterase-like activity of phytase family protein [Beijerinckiaceae bacterium]|nr:esterase-like activity of phytase family protein [Beijerinckiaceae bacterium]